jgi:1-acyl-sn-glycerol-3-phosphate acyltransferase
VTKLFWIISLLGAVAGGFSLFGSFAEDSAPKQAAAAAIAAGLAIIPYCLARSVEAIGRRDPEPLTLQDAEPMPQEELAPEEDHDARTRALIDRLQK